uniref:Uncharacterized protein n=1 Tax=Anguilla anguilla TaxID=7936 RepID=A0A0E9QSI7_ANGAN
MLGYFLIVNQHTCLFRIYHKSTKYSGCLLIVLTVG